MSTTTVNTDKNVFFQLVLAHQDADRYAWLATADEITEALAAGAEHRGPAFSLWTESAEGRIPIYRYAHRVPTNVGVFHQHILGREKSWGDPNYILDKAGEPIGYATTEDKAEDDCLPVLQCHHGPYRKVWTQWDRELTALQQEHGMTTEPTTWWAPAAHIVEVKSNAAHDGVDLSTSDRRAIDDGSVDVNVYRGKGNAIRFEAVEGAEFPAEGALTVKFKGTDRSAIGVDENGQPLPFQWGPAYGSTSRCLLVDDEQTESDAQYDYKLTVVYDGHELSHDPKIIQRKTQLVD